MIANLLTNFLGIVIFLFLFWKKLKEDHVSETIFSSASIILGGILASYLISLRFFPNWLFWIDVLVISLTYVFSIYRFKMRPFETLDALVISLLPWFSLIFLKDSVVNSSLISFISFVIVLILIFVYYFFDSHYKRFTWYKSGRIGFSGVSTLGILFLTRATTSLTLPRVLTFTDVYEPFLSGVLVITSVVIIFWLAKEVE